MQVAIIFDDRAEGIIQLFVVPKPTQDEDLWLNICHSHLIGDTMDEAPERWLEQWLENREPEHVCDHVKEVRLLVPTRLIFTGRM